MLDERKHSTYKVMRRKMDFEIIKKFDQIEPYIEQINSSADQNKKSLGFLPHPAYQEHALQGRLWVCIDDKSEYCGHLIFGGKLPSLHVIQIFVVKANRQDGLAAKLLCELERYGEAHHCLSITARVAADLKANQFWERQGYKISQQVDGGKTTGRRINIRVKDLDVPSLFDFAEMSPETQHTDLIVKAKTTLTSTTYAIDVNVMLDLTKSRANAEMVQQLIGFSMYGNGQLCITAEFVAELEKQTQAHHQDPLLELTKSLPTLPKVSESVLEPIVSQLRAIVFPDRQHLNILSGNDKSDLSHIAQCIHHEITGFITSEKEILKASEILYHTFGIEILSPAEVVNLVVSDSEQIHEGMSFSHAGSSLTINNIEEKDRQDIECFLLNQGVSETERREMLDSGVVSHSRSRWVVKNDNAVLGYSSWGGDELNNHRIFYLIVDEKFSAAQNLIDHFIEKIVSSLPASKLSLIFLRTSIGNDLTRKTALDRGFRKITGINTEPGNYELVKISYKGYVNRSAWLDFKTSVSKTVDLTLPDRMPTYDEFVYTGAVLASKSVQGVVKLPLFEMETIFSPAVFLCSGRDAVIIPIRRQYVERLMSESIKQLNLLPSNEALMHVEKAYFKSARNTKLIKRGDLVLFYVSGKDGGQEIIGHGRVTSSSIMDVTSAVLKLQRQGALDEDGLNEIADDKGDVHAVTFDNFLLLDNPVSYAFLKKNNMISGANLVTAERINAKTLTNIISEGEKHE